MPQYCSVRKCKSTLRKNNGISFHCYPKDENRRQLWLNALRLNALKWDCRPRVCSKHFKKEDFVFGGNVVKLKKSAIPSVGSVNDGVPALGEMQNIPSSSTTTIENENTPKMPVPETRPANCMSPSVCSTSNVLTETPGVSHYRVETAINTKQQRKHSTSKVSENVSSDVSMTWVDDSVNADFSPLKEHRLTLTTNVVKTPTKITKIQTKKPVSDATGNPISSSVTMSWISDLPEDQPDQAGNDELNTLTTSTPQIEKDSMEICKGNCSSLKTVEILENEVAYLKRENQRLQLLSLPKPLFCLQQFSANDKKILYYTGFQTYEILCLVFKWVLPSGDLKDITIYDASPRVKKHERLSKLSAENHFFLTLIRLRRGMSIETLSDMFSISKAYVNSIFLSWINLLYLRLGSLDIWPNRNELINRASDKMRQNYPNVIGSIDCTEFFIQRPSSLVKQSQCYSNYKGATTLKSLIMIDPAGAIIYTSPYYLFLIKRLLKLVGL